MDNFERANGDDAISIQKSQNGLNYAQAEIGGENAENQRGPENRKNARKNRVFIKFPQVFNATTIVALLALLVSFTTTLISYRQAAQQNIQNQKNELRSLLQRTIALPKESAEIMTKYHDNPDALTMISGYLTQENQLLFSQIDNLLAIIPQEHLSAIEYYSASTALLNSGEFSRAKEYAAKSMIMAVNAKDVYLQLALLRLNAEISFQLGEYDKGREYYEKALNIFDETGEDYSYLNDFIKLSCHIQTELNWAYAEGNSFNFDKIHSHIRNARKYLNKMPDTPGRRVWQAQISNTEGNMQSVINL